MPDEVCVTIQRDAAVHQMVAYRAQDYPVAIFTSMAGTGPLSRRLPEASWIAYLDLGIAEILRTDDPRFFEPDMVADLSVRPGVAVFVTTDRGVQSSGIGVNSDRVARFRLDGPLARADELVAKIDGIDPEFGAASRRVVEGRRP